MFLCVNMFDLYVPIFSKTSEIMILDRNVLRTRSHFLISCECDCPLIFFVNCDWGFKKTTQYRWGVSLQLEYKLNFFHKTHKSQDLLHFLININVFRLHCSERYFCLVSARQYNQAIIISNYLVHNG